MGAGKTTIIRSICTALGATDTVTSPTFTLVNEYKTTSGSPIYHIDFYRIKKAEEVFDFGIEEYFDSDSYCFMEWPELIENFLPPETVRVRISVGSNEERILEIE
jgi:tRNA threonylcarbamoyladenosine biosynthesis protein TsaE